MASSPTTRSTLIAKLRDRADSAAWEEFVDLYTPLLRRIARQRGLQDADAAEVVQEVLISVVKALPSYQHTGRAGSFRRWLITIAKNKTLNRLTRRKPDEFAAGDAHLHALITQESSREKKSDETFEREWQHQLFVLAAEHVRKTVQPKTWSAFWWTAVELRSPEDVARDLELELGAVYVARSRVLTKIRSWVRDQSSRWES